MGRLGHKRSKEHNDTGSLALALFDAAQRKVASTVKSRGGQVESGDGSFERFQGPALCAVAPGQLHDVTVGKASQAVVVRWEQGPAWDVQKQYYDKPAGPIPVDCPTQGRATPLDPVSHDNAVLVQHRHKGATTDHGGRVTKEPPLLLDAGGDTACHLIGNLDVRLSLL